MTNEQHDFDSMTLDDLLEEDCLHCAISYFIFKWRSHKPKENDRAELASIIAKLLESTADALSSISQPDRDIACDLALDRFKSDIDDIKDGTYEEGVPVIKESEIKGERKH